MRSLLFITIILFSNHLFSQEAFKQHNVSWDTPSLNSMGSMPAGNGDVGVNLWVEKNGDLLFYLSKTDAWSENARLLKIGKVSLSIAPNPFKEGVHFLQELNIQDGLIHIEAGERKNKVSIDVWVDANHPVVEIDVKSIAPVSVEVSTEPWRTTRRHMTNKTETHSAYGINDRPDIFVEKDSILANTNTNAEIVWLHRNERSIWEDNLKLQSLDDFIKKSKDPLLGRTFGALIHSEELKNHNSATLKSTVPLKQFSVSVYAHTSQTETQDEWIEQIKEKVLDIKTKSRKERLKDHKSWWHSFWDRSYIHVSSQDDKEKEEVFNVSKNYTLQRYMNACSGRGNAAIKFNGSIFTVDTKNLPGKYNGFDADYRQWGGCYWWQNTRLPYWSMLEAGDFDLMKPLFNMYREALPVRKLATETYYKHKGAFFPETMHFWGTYADANYGRDRSELPIGMTENRFIRYYWQSGLEISLMMLDYYSFTNDEKFLEETLLPVVTEIINFFDQHWGRDENGKILFDPAMALETYNTAVNPLPEIVGISKVCTELLSLPADMVKDKQQKQWKRLINEMPEIPTQMHNGNKLLAPAHEYSGKQNVENPELYGIFPYRVFGIGKEKLDMVRLTFANRAIKHTGGWQQNAIKAAYLGLSEEAAKFTMTNFNSGTGSYRFPTMWGPNYDWTPDQCHGTVAMTALQRMLVQYDGERIYLLPAWPENWNAEFKLYAPKNTIIVGEVIDGKLERIKVTPKEREKDVINFWKNTSNTDSHKLWYQQPAKASVIDDPAGWKDDPEWLRALPLGNGSLGAMVFGDVNKERIQLNEESMWSGSPEDNDNLEAFPAQDEIRKLLLEGKYKEATELTQKTQICKGKGSGHGNGANVPFGCFQTLGDLWIDFEKESTYENYHRELDLEAAVARVSYTQEGVQYKREIFVSQPDQLMAIRLTADKPGKISFKSSMTRPEKFQTRAENNQLIMHGVLSNGKGGDGIQYIARLAAANKNGTVRYADKYLIVENADEVTLLLTSSTDYVLEYPNYKGRDHKKITGTNLQKGSQTSFEELLERHKEEYQKYYKRVDFKLTSELPDTIPTDVRLQQFKESESESDLKLVELMFQYGRYLLISSSRPGTLPANLQGIWANKIQTPWNGDYHTDVNVQMNYWLAENTNLSEMHLPLFDLMKSIQEPGAKTAKVHYNAHGWVVHPITNIWGFTAPGENSGWGMHVGGGAWLATHIMEHYYYTLDKAFLKETYPILKASTQFYMDWLIPDPKTGELISGPSVSPENQFIAPDGSISKICMGPAHDQQVIWQLFKNFIDASEALNIDDDFLQKVIKSQRELVKPKIGIDGRLMEWNEEFEEVEPGHRHISHLFALHPGYQIDVHKTPELALAARKSLDFRIQNGGGHTGWSAAWLINQYARLGDAENAKHSLNTVLRKSTSPNLFGLHPPFQMDANFGTTSGIAEMLLQSQSGEISLLPALPKDWENGEVKGLCARGGFVIDMKWESGELVSVRVYSKKGGSCTLVYKGKEITFETESEMEYFPM